MLPLIQPRLYYDLFSKILQVSLGIYWYLAVGNKVVHGYDSSSSYVLRLG